MALKTIICDGEDMELSIINFLNTKLKAAIKICGLDYQGNCVSFSNRPDMADFQSNVCFVLSKTLKKRPDEIAGLIINALDEETKSIFNVELCAPAYINFKFNDGAVVKFLNDYLTGAKFEQVGKGKTAVLDYGGANIAKELHMGHLRSPIIGESIKRIYSLFGYNTIADVHLGDWGLQMGLVIAMLDELDMLGYYFGKGGKKPEITLDFLNENYPKASKRSKIDPEFKVKAETYTLYLQQLKEPYYTIWKDIKAVSVVAIKRNYENLNCKFDLWYGESDAQKYIKQTIDTFIQKGLARESEDALVVDVKREGEHIPIPKKDPLDPNEKQLYKNPMPPVIIKKHNGGDLYATTDLATIVERVKDNKNLSEIIYVTDKRQANHFEGVFRASRMAGLVPDSVKLTHVGYGTMNGKDGKPFKTRDGGVVKLEDVINLVTSRAEEKLKANGVNADNDNQLARQIGVGAMKFGDLCNEASRDYVFDIDSFMSFEGKTGPYLQYTAVRIKSLLQKAGNFGVKITDASEFGRKLLMDILKQEDAFIGALGQLSPSLICTATYNLASTFSTLYNNVRILNEADESRRNSLLSLCKLVLDRITLGLECLAIDIPDKM